MYKVLLNDTVFYDARIDDLAIIEPVLELEENSAGVFKFTVPPTHPRYEDIESRSVFTVLKDDAVIWQGVVVDISISFYKEKTVNCDGELVFLNETVLRPQHFQGSLAQVFTQFIKLHNSQVEDAKKFEVGTITATSWRSLNCYSNMETPMQCIKDHCIDISGGVIRLRYENGHRYIDYLKEDSFRTSNQVIKLGVNLTNYTSNLDNTDICSCVIPLGAKEETTSLEGVETKITIKSVNNNSDVLIDQDKVDIYGYVYKVLNYDNETEPSTLKTLGQKYLEETQFDSVVLEVSAVDLALVDYGVNTFNLGDQIRVISAPHGLNKYFRLTKQTLNLLAPENDTITLGKEEKKSISAKTASVNDTVKEQIYNAITPTSNILELATKNASSLINGNGENGYVVFHTNSAGQPFEILIMNTTSLDTATKVWRWNSNGLGYGKRNNTSDPLTFGLAMTIDGSIVADYINAGKLQGVEIIGETGKIGGLTLTNSSMFKNTNSISSTTPGIYVGTNGIRVQGSYDAGMGLTPYTKITQGVIETNWQNVSYIDLNYGSYLSRITKDGFVRNTDTGTTGYEVMKWANESNNNRYVMLWANPHSTSYDPLVFMTADHDGHQSYLKMKNGWIELNSITDDNIAARISGKSGMVETKYNDYYVDIGGMINYQITTNGAIKCSFVTETSDERLKKDIETIGEEYAEEIYKLRPVKYKFKSDESEHLGFIAQEVKELELEGVVNGGETEEDFYSLSYSGLIAPLVATVQHQHNEIEELKRQIEEIKEALNG